MHVFLARVWRGGQTPPSRSPPDQRSKLSLLGEGVPFPPPRAPPPAQKPHMGWPLAKRYPREKKHNWDGPSRSDTPGSRCDTPGHETTIVTASREAIPPDRDATPPGTKPQLGRPLAKRCPRLAKRYPRARNRRWGGPSRSGTTALRRTRLSRSELPNRWVIGKTWNTTTYFSLGEFPKRRV